MMADAEKGNAEATNKIQPLERGFTIRQINRSAAKGTTGSKSVFLSSFHPFRNPPLHQKPAERLASRIDDARAKDMESWKERWGVDIEPTDFSISMMHMRNLEYTPAKVLRHEHILQAVQLEEGKGSEDALESIMPRGSFKPLCTMERFERIQEDLAQYSLALNNYVAWKAVLKEGFKNYSPLSCVDNPAVGLATLEYEKYYKQSSGEELADVENNIINHLSPVSYGGSTLGLDKLRETMGHKRKEEANFFSRLAMALFGGLALIVPMLIMSLHQTKVTSLVTTSVFVVGVAITLAWWMKEAQSKDIMAATAAYAAVLVVFVGAGTTTTG